MQIHIQLYQIDYERHPILWRKVEAAFSELKIRPADFPPDSVGKHWMLGEHPAYVPLMEYEDQGLEVRKRGRIGKVDIDDAPAVFPHAIWKGVNTLLCAEECWVALRVGALSCVLVSSERKLAELPTYMDDEHFRFVSTSSERIAEIVTTAMALNSVLNQGQARLGWAEANTIDTEVFGTFLQFVGGKRTKKQSLDWCGLKIDYRPGKFSDTYVDWVDWRSDDDDVVYWASSRLAQSNLLMHSINDEGLTIIYGDKEKRLSLDEIGKERYCTIRAVNELLSGDYEWRVLTETLTSDTCGLVMAPSIFWEELEKANADGLRKKFTVVTSDIGFYAN